MTTYLPPLKINETFNVADYNYQDGPVSVGTAESRYLKRVGTDVCNASITFQKTLTINGTVNVNAVAISPTEFSYLSGTTSNIQIQIDNIPVSLKNNNNIWLGQQTFTNITTFQNDIVVNGTNISTTELSYLDGVTSSVQTQLTNCVHKSGDESISGIKKFNTAPQTIASQTSAVANDFVTKGFTDTTYQPLGTNGYFGVFWNTGSITLTTTATVLSFTTADNNNTGIVFNATAPTSQIKFTYSGNYKISLSPRVSRVVSASATLVSVSFYVRKNGTTIVPNSYFTVTYPATATLSTEIQIPNINFILSGVVAGDYYETLGVTSSTTNQVLSLAASSTTSPITPSILLTVTSINGGSYVDLVSNQSVAGIKTFTSPPAMSGGSITTGTIPITSVVGTAMDLTTNQTVSGIKTFSNAPVMSGGSISSGTIPITSVVGTAMDVTTNQTVSGIKTFSNAPVMSGGSITTSTIPITSVVGTAMDLTTNQTVSGVKIFSNAPVMSGGSISSGTIPVTSVAGTAMDLTTNQTVSGIKTYSNAPVMSGASITSGTIPTAAVAGTAMDLTSSQNIVGVKTFSTPPVISSISNTGIVSFPTTTDTLVGRATTDTMTNKTMDSPIITGYARAVTAPTGTSTTQIATCKFVLNNIGSSGGANYPILNNSWSGTNDYTLNLPTSTLQPTFDNDFINKKYADDNGRIGLLQSQNTFLNVNTFSQTINCQDIVADDVTAKTTTLNGIPYTSTVPVQIITGTNSTTSTVTSGSTSTVYNYFTAGSATFKTNSNLTYTVYMIGGGASGGRTTISSNGGGGGGYLKLASIYVAANTLFTIAVGQKQTAFNSNGNSTTLTVGTNIFSANGGGVNQSSYNIGGGTSIGTYGGTVTTQQGANGGVRQTNGVGTNGGDGTSITIGTFSQLICAGGGGSGYFDTSNRPFRGGYGGNAGASGGNGGNSGVTAPACTDGVTKGSGGGGNISSLPLSGITNASVAGTGQKGYLVIVYSYSTSALSPTLTINPNNVSQQALSCYGASIFNELTTCQGGINIKRTIPNYSTGWLLYNTDTFYTITHNLAWSLDYPIRIRVLLSHTSSNPVIRTDDIYDLGDISQMSGLITQSANYAWGIASICHISNNAFELHTSYNGVFYEATGVTGRTTYNWTSAYMRVYCYY